VHSTLTYFHLQRLSRRSLKVCIHVCVSTYAGPRGTVPSSAQELLQAERHVHATDACSVRICIRQQASQSSFCQAPHMSTRGPRNNHQWRTQWALHACRPANKTRAHSKKHQERPPDRGSLERSAYSTRRGVRKQNNRKASTGRCGSVLGHKYKSIAANVLYSLATTGPWVYYIKCLLLL
jgi:hypothetical protein